MNAGVIVSSRESNGQRLPWMDRAGGVQADIVGDAVQVDARIYGHAVAIGAAVLKTIDGRDRNSIGIEIAELSRLLEAKAAAVPGDARAQVVMIAQPVSLGRAAPGVLPIIGARKNAGALFRRFALFECLCDAAPIRVGLRSGIARCGKAAVSGGSSDDC